LISTDRVWLRTRGARLAALLGAGVLLTASAHGFVYSEHRAIAGAAIAGLAPERAATLARLWAAAREGYEVRLCGEPWTGESGLDQPCVDLAAWSAIGGLRLVFEGRRCF
jgi:hypothetical protein